VRVGVNGSIAATASPDEFADALVITIDAGPRLRASTMAWFRENARAMSVGRSIDVVERTYGVHSALHQTTQF
jgi:hypothetical protein